MGDSNWDFPEGESEARIVNGRCTECNNRNVYKRGHSSGCSRYSDDFDEPDTDDYEDSEPGDWY